MNTKTLLVVFAIVAVAATFVAEELITITVFELLLTFFPDWFSAFSL
jgi:uncharacterized membrane protein